jgi:hypothetical protein
MYILYTQVCIIYRFSKEFMKCSKYIYKEVVYDNNFSKVDLNKLFKKKARLEAA